MISSLSTSADSNIVPFIRQDKSKADTKKDSKLKTSHAGYRHTTTNLPFFSWLEERIEKFMDKMW